MQAQRSVDCRFPDNLVFWISLSIWPFMVVISPSNIVMLFRNLESALRIRGTTQAFECATLRNLIYVILAANPGVPAVKISIKRRIA